MCGTGMIGLTVGRVSADARLILKRLSDGASGEQDKDDECQQCDSSAGEIGPPPAAWPSGKRADQEQY
jgi:hypothetical protein